MRYTVRFGHAKYLEVADRFLQEPDYHIPEGVYRGLDVVVEASNPHEALHRACDQLGWPDQEVLLVPFSIPSELETRANLETIRGARAILDFWRDSGHMAHISTLEAAVGLQTSSLARRP